MFNKQFDTNVVKEVYSGAEGRLWELIMGEQVHIGGLQSSIELAKKTQILPGSKGIDLCCCSGAGMRFLIKFHQVANMLGVDMTEVVVAIGKRRCDELGLSERIQFKIANVTDTGLPDADADFVWGQDAWCYVNGKAALIKEAVRLVRRGGKIAFTDWLAGPELMSDSDYQRLLKFMKFPSMQTLDGYSDLLKANGCEVIIAEDTGRFAPFVDLYLKMLSDQLAYDALKIINFDLQMFEAIADEMKFMQVLAHERKIIQGLIIARKNPSDR